MISEAMLKRQAQQAEKKKRISAAAGESSDGGGNGTSDNAKSKEAEKMERLVKTIEENYKKELVEL